MKLKTVKSFLAAAIATVAALVSTVASAYDDGVLSTPDGTVERKDLGGDRYAYVFTNASAATTATLGQNAMLIEALVVGGGGGGGGRAPSSNGRATGGGGAGGFAYYPELGDALASGTVIDIRVGAGGEGGLGSLSGSNGGESSLVVAGRSFVVPGGGGGAKGYGNGNLGSEGGSGGGGSGQNAGGPGLTGFGFAGAPGTQKNGNQAGGGGGAGGPGLVYAKNIGGAGGPGRYCAITGENLCYAGGGAPSNGRAGEGGGGTPNASGTDGFGGGGGGATTSDAAAGAGGAGTVIIVLAARDGLVAEAIPAQTLTIGVPCEPHPTVHTMGGTTLTEDQDYVLSWADNTSVGRATVTVQGIGSYSGMFDRVPFEIEMDQFSDEFIETSDVTCRRLVVGDRHVYIFTNTFSQVSVTVKSALLLDSALIVAGGGGGGIGGNGKATSPGIGGGGGGGAGGVIAVKNAPVYMSASSTLNLSVGFGGAGSSDSTKRGASGGNSILSYGDLSLVAVGGGGGGCDKYGQETAGSAGGSGGGGAYASAGGAGTEEQGCAGSGGAAASSNHYAGGGGGAGGPGEASVTAYCVNTQSGNGGPGVMNDITGVEVCYAGGGGGGGANGFTAGGLGGIGGGAEGGCSSVGYDGANGLGGGGGGGGCDATKVGQAGGSGGSGVVILSFSRLPIAVADIPVQLFVGAPVEPEVTVTDVKTSAVLTPGEDYGVTYANNTGVGTGTATVTGLGKYEGVEISVDFIIELGIQIPEIPAQALVAGGARPKLVLVNRVTGATLVEGQDYELTYADNEAPGMATVSIKGLAAYESITVVRTFEVVLALMVTPDATGSGDGHTWESPMTFNQAKVAVLATGGEIWLKEGTYAFEEEPESIGANDCAVCIRGGYAGLSGTSADAREGAKSTLSGEDAYDTLTLTNAAEVTLQRLVITRGLNHGLAKTSGSGSVTLEDCEIRNNGSQRAKLEGGRGLYVLGCNTLTIRRCVFAGNVVGEADFDVATTGGNEYGTAMYAQNCALVMSDTAFVTNGIPAGKPAETVFRRSKCLYYGAALYLSTVSSATLSGCSFVANRAPSVRDSFGYSQGAILYFTQCSSVSFANCLVAGNSVIGANTDSGCGNVVYFTGNKSNTLSIDSCTFAYNLIRANTSLIGGTPAKATVVNSVFYGNVGDATATAPRDLACGAGGVTLGYSLFAGTGGENIAAGVTKTDGVIAGDPLFVTSPDDFLALVENENPDLDRMTWPYRFNPEKIDELVNIDCHLLSAQGYVDNAGVQHTAPGKKSPAIDAGDPANGAWVNEPGANGGRLNAGRYAGTAEASQTPKPGTPEIDPEGVEISFPNEYTQPQIDFTMGGEGVYLASVRIFCGTGELARTGTAYSWSTEFAGVANGDDVSWKLPGYVAEESQVYYAIVVTSDGRTQKPVTAEATAEGTCPPWAGKGGGANVMHVRAGAEGASDGSDWSNAYPDLCAALDNLTPEKTEVWVAGETPVSPTTLVQSHPVSRDIVIRGGFGGTESSLSERPAGTRTVIDQSGEKLGLQLTLLPGANVRLERFRFVGASARALSVTHGGASLVLEDCEILNNVMGVAVSGSGAGSVSITNCLFAGNLANDSYTAAVSGRALSVKNCTRLTLDDCLFATNGVTAAYVDAPHSTCDVGAALFLQDAKVTARNVRFVGNRVRRIVAGSETGGGICRLEYSDGNSPAKIADSAFTNCLWVGNEERRYVNCKSAQGGGMVWLPANVKASGTAVGDITFANCTFACNLSVGGGNAQGDTTAAGINVSANRVIVRNSIFYANMIRKDTFCGSDICAKGGAAVDVDYSLFEGNGTNWVTGADVTLGSHNIYGSPCFVTTDAEFLAAIDKDGEGSVSRWDGEPAFNAEATDRICAFNVHLRGRFGYYDEATGERVMDYRYPRSPAVDAGDPASDYFNEPKPNGGRINMGCYGNTPWATMANGGLLLILN